MSEQTCTGCGITKPLSDFYRKSAAADAPHITRCKECKNADGRRWRAANPEKVKEWRAAVDARRDRKAYWRSWHAENSDKHRAHLAVHRALKSGALVRPDVCENCDGADPQAHHEDYARPLHVRWLCQRCHSHVHHGLVA